MSDGRDPKKMSFSDKHEEMELLGWFVYLFRDRPEFHFHERARLKARLIQLFKSMTVQEQELCKAIAPQERFKAGEV